MATLAETTIGILAGVGGVFGIRAGTEEPRFRVLEHVGAVEIRQYGPRLAAETTVSGPDEAARNEGFRKIAGYIFGGNTAKSSIAMTAPVAQSAAPDKSAVSEKIAMTAPVAQTAGGPGAWRVQFFMPARYTRQSLPTPSDPAVRIVEVPAQAFAVLRFSGSRTGPVVAARQKQLVAALASSPWRVTGEPSAWFYDPPWTPPFLRRNEVAAPVVRAD
jgi:hypothetical protein